MNEIPECLRSGSFDFCYSCCAIEHVGTLELSKNFIKNMIDTLKPGGIAVHTTEFNILSNSDTIETGTSVIWRKKDLEEIAQWCKENGHEIHLSFKRSKEEGDIFVDRPPFFQHKYHLNLFLSGYFATSYGIVIKKKRD